MNRGAALTLLVIGSVVAVVPNVEAAPTVVATIPVGQSPHGIAVDATSNRIFVANLFSHNVSVIDGTTDSVIATMGPVSFPKGVAVDSDRRRVYVTGSDSVAVFDEDTNASLGAIAVGSGPRGIALNSVTGLVYVGNRLSNSVSVIDEATATVTATIPVGANPLFLAVDTERNRIYVTNTNDNSMSVIDGATNTVVSTIPTDTPYGVAVDESTNRVYVSNLSAGTMSIIDGATGSLIAQPVLGTSPSAACCPQGLAVDPRTHRAYAAGAAAKVAMVNTMTSAFMTLVQTSGLNPVDIAANPDTSLLYVTDEEANIVTVIREDGADTTPPTTTATVKSGGAPAVELDGQKWTAGFWRVTLTCSDTGDGCQRTEYQVDSGPVAEYSSPFRVTTEGLHQVRFRSTDRLGNTEAFKTVLLGIDRTPPTTAAQTSASEPSTSNWSRGSWTVALSCSDPAAGSPPGASGCRRAEYRVDGGALVPYSGPFTIDTEGRHTVSFRSVDKVGNVGREGGLQLNIDRGAPHTRMHTSAGSIFLPPLLPVRLLASAQDPTLADGSAGSGVISLCFDVYAVAPDGQRTYVDCFAAAPTSEGFWHASPDLPSGTYDASARATDLVSNSSYSDAIRFTVIRAL